MKKMMFLTVMVFGLQSFAEYKPARPQNKCETIAVTQAMKVKRIVETHYGLDDISKIIEINAGYVIEFDNGEDAASIFVKSAMTMFDASKGGIVECDKGQTVDLLDVK